MEPNEKLFTFQELQGVVNDVLQTKETITVEDFKKLEARLYLQKIPEVRSFLFGEKNEIPRDKVDYFFKVFSPIGWSIYAPSVPILNGIMYIKYGEMKYLVDSGWFFLYENEAKEYLEEIKNLGFSSAFVVYPDPQFEWPGRNGEGKFIVVTGENKELIIKATSCREYSIPNYINPTNPSDTIKTLFNAVTKHITDILQIGLFQLPISWLNAYTVKNDRITITNHEQLIGKLDGATSVILKFLKGSKVGHLLWNKDLLLLKDKAEFNSSPFVLDVKGIAKHNNCYYLILPLYEGNLRDRTIQGLGDAIDQLVVSFCLGKVVEDVHSKDRGFLDLRPENVYFYLKSSGLGKYSIMLGEIFNSSKSYNGEYKRPDNNSLSCNSAPELYLDNDNSLLRDEKQAYQADIWGLGCLLYEITFLHHPFKNKPVDEIKKFFIETQTMEEIFSFDKRGDAPTVLEPIIRKCLVRDPNGRISLKEYLDLVVNELHKVEGVALPTENVTKRFIEDIGYVENLNQK
jgi:hypothetical protein